MILEEFVFDKKQAEKALEKLNKKKAQSGDGYDPGDGSFIMENCKCPYGDVDPLDCEDLCRLNHK